MGDPNKQKPHIAIIRITITVLVIGQLINACQERQRHQEIWDSLIEIQGELNLSIESQNRHLQNVQDFAEEFLESLRAEETDEPRISELKNELGQSVVK